MRKKTDWGIYNLICFRKILTQHCLSIAGILNFILKHLQREISPISMDHLEQRNVFSLHPKVITMTLDSAEEKSCHLSWHKQLKPANIK